VIGGLYALSWALEVVVGILFAVAAHTALTRLRVSMFANLVAQDVAFYDKHVSGELSSRLINDSGQLQGLVQFVSQNLLQAVVRIAGGLVAMYLTHPLLALLATVITPLNWFIIRRAGEIQGRYGAVQNHAIARANVAAIEALGAVRTAPRPHARTPARPHALAPSTVKPRHLPTAAGTHRARQRRRARRGAPIRHGHPPLPARRDRHCAHADRRHLHAALPIQAA
jgi:hypothetical protein